LNGKVRELSPFDDRTWRPAANVPVRGYEDEALKTFSGRIGSGSLIQPGAPVIAAPLWNRDRLTRLFRSEIATHSFHVEPHRWTRFHEPQITTGFAYFLNRGDHPRRLARAVSLVKAASVCAGEDPADIDKFGATASFCVAEENRTDLLVELRRGSSRLGASIEAKFNHGLTKGQLAKALAYARDERGWTISASMLLVVAPDDLTADKIMLANREDGWRSTTWWALLLSLEQMIGCEHDDDEYRRFRRTTWHRAYGRHR
jgi:hypothetical protein